MTSYNQFSKKAMSQILLSNQCNAVFFSHFKQEGIVSKNDGINIKCRYCIYWWTICRIRKRRSFIMDKSALILLPIVLSSVAISLNDLECKVSNLGLSSEPNFHVLQMIRFISLFSLRGVMVSFCTVCCYFFQFEYILLTLFLCGM